MWNLYLGLALGAWVLMFLVGVQRKGDIPIDIFTYMAFLFWLAVILGIWEHGLWIAALLSCVPGLLGTYSLFLSLNKWVSNK